MDFSKMSVGQRVDKKGQRSPTADKAIDVAKKFNKIQIGLGLGALAVAGPLALVGVPAAGVVAGGAAAYSAWNGAEYVGWKAYDKHRDKKYGPKAHMSEGKRHSLFNRKSHQSQVNTKDLALAA